MRCGRSTSSFACAKSGGEHAISRRFAQSEASESSHQRLEIVGKGVVEGGKERAYEFDSSGRLKTPTGFTWSHQVPVKWESAFPPVKIFLGAEPLTVRELLPDKLKLLEEAIDKVALFGFFVLKFFLANNIILIPNGTSKTTLDDIALVCANCHAMIHAKNPPISIEEMRKLVTHH
jgi:hypothetical protein